MLQKRDNTNIWGRTRTLSQAQKALFFDLELMLSVYGAETLTWTQLSKRLGMRNRQIVSLKNDIAVLVEEGLITVNWLIEDGSVIPALGRSEIDCQMVAVGGNRLSDGGSWLSDGGNVLSVGCQLTEIPESQEMRESRLNTDRQARFVQKNKGENTVIITFDQNPEEKIKKEKEKKESIPFPPHPPIPIKEKKEKEKNLVRLGDISNDKNSEESSCRLLSTPSEDVGKAKYKPINPATMPKGFVTFWATYPQERRVAKSKCLEKWKKQGLEEVCAIIIAHVRKAKDQDDVWKRGYAPNAETYINQRRWEDDATIVVDGETKQPVAIRSEADEAKIRELRRFAIGMRQKIDGEVEGFGDSPKENYDALDNAIAELKKLGVNDV